MATISFEQVMLPLSAALGAAVGVERILEAAKSIMEPFIGKGSGRKVGEATLADLNMEELRYRCAVTEAAREIDSEPERRLDALQTLAGKLGPAGEADQKAQDEARRLVDAEGEWAEQCPPSRMLVQEATDPDDGTVLRSFVLQLLGAAAGIIAARLFDIQLFHAFQLFAPAGNAGWDYLLTGLLIGGGSAPVHVLIQFISERKLPTVAAEIGAAELKPAEDAAQAGAPAVITAPPVGDLRGWIDIPYSGGVDRDLLENFHRRRSDPELVVFHHTAMKSRSTFEDVVRVIKGRTDSKGNQWLTGYNCVVMADGAINAFCRWDRYGSHASGYNQRSLGLAFNGNFETDPKVRYSNATGNYGPQRPTEEQLKAGARVVVLWSFLYPKIDVNKFAETIIPHKQIAGTVCPGNMFPYDEFRKWVEFYRLQWEASAAVQERIALFQQKLYVYIKKEA